MEDKLTVDKLITRLQEISKEGYGSSPVVGSLDNYISDVKLKDLYHCADFEDGSEYNVTTEVDSLGKEISQEFLDINATFEGKCVRIR